jgi:hypothetical protein
MTVRRTAGIAALLVAFLGCGGSDQQSTTPPEVFGALARSAFVDRADRICTQGRKRLILTGNRYFGDLPAGRDPSEAAVTAYARREAIPILRHQYGRLRELRPPSGDAQEINRILDLAERGIGQLQSDPTLLNRGSGIPPALERARHRAFLYGLGACGQPIERPTRGSDLGA